ncbi:hypothetical protein ACWIUD_03490 [Helicobacter sp. 23-1044]
MLDKINLFCSNIFHKIYLQSAISRAKSIIEKRMDEVEFGVLGRSLCLNQLPPRDFSTLKNAEIKSIKSLKEAQSLSKIAESTAIIANTTLQKDISLVADIRKYTPFLILQSDIFISKYQILEALVFGADGVILSPMILPKSSLLALQEYAYHLGMEVAILARTREHFALKANIFIAPKILADSAPNKSLIFLQNIIDFK